MSQPSYDDKLHQILNRATTMTLSTPEADIDVLIPTESLLTQLFELYNSLAVATNNRKIEALGNRLVITEENLRRLEAVYNEKLTQISALKDYVDSKKQVLDLALKSCLACSTTPGHKATSLVKQLYTIPYANAILGDLSLTSEYSADFTLVIRRLTADLLDTTSMLDRLTKTLTNVIQSRSQSLTNTTQSNIATMYDKFNTALHKMRQWQDEIPQQSTKQFFEDINVIREVEPVFNRLVDAFEPLDLRSRHEGEGDNDYDSLVVPGREHIKSLRTLKDVALLLIPLKDKVIEAEAYYNVNPEKLNEVASNLTSELKTLETATQAYEQYITAFNDAAHRLEDVMTRSQERWAEFNDKRSEWNSKWPDFENKINAEVSRIKGFTVSTAQQWTFESAVGNVMSTVTNVPYRLTFDQLLGIIPHVSRSTHQIKTNAQSMTLGSKQYKVLNNQIMYREDQEDHMVAWAAGLPAIMNQYLGSSGWLIYMFNIRTQMWAFVTIIGSSTTEQIHIFSYTSGSVNNVRTLIPVPFGDMHNINPFIPGINRILGETQNNWYAVFAWRR